MRNAIQTARYGLIQLRRICYSSRIDYYTITIFFSILSFLLLTWRIGFIINDNYTLANMLVNLSNGSLSIKQIEFGAAVSPGTYTDGERLYGRNYGHVFTALVPYILLELIFSVVYPVVAFSAMLSISIVISALGIYKVTGGEGKFLLLGSLTATGIFLLNITFSSSLASRWTPVIALQLVSIIATSLLGAILYQMLSAMYTRPVAVAAGIAVVVTTPVGFWGTIPKRHAWVALFAVAVLYAVYMGKRAEIEGTITRYRMLAYGLVGIGTWMDPAEGFLLFIPLMIVDGIDIPNYKLKSNMLVLTVFTVCLLPFFITNMLITGSPLKPPFLLASYSGEETIVLDSEIATSSTQKQNPAPQVENTGDTSRPITEELRIATEAGANNILLFTNQFQQGIYSVFDPERAYSVFVRSGYLETVSARGNSLINLTVLESMPLLGALIVAPLLLAHKLVSDILIRVFKSKPVDIDSHQLTPQRAADLFVTIYAILVIIVSLPQLPIHASITVRYLHILYPLGMYGIIRTSAIRRLINTDWRTLVWVYTITVFIGGQIVFALLAVMQASIGEAMQIYAMLALLSSLLIATYSVVVQFLSKIEVVAPIVVGVAAGLTTVFLIISSIELFDYGVIHAIPISDMLSEVIDINI